MYSASQFTSAMKCGWMWKLANIDHVQAMDTRVSWLLGTVVGNAIAELALTLRGAPLNMDTCDAAFIKHLCKTLKDHGTPDELIDLTVPLFKRQSKYMAYNESGPQEIPHAQYLDWLDQKYKAAQRGMAWKYDGQEKKSRKDRFLEKFPWYVNAVHNGYLTLCERGLLNRVVDVQAEFHAVQLGQEFDIHGYFDLLIVYENGKVAVVEIKTSKLDRQDLDHASACGQDQNFCHKHLQSLMYHLMAKSLFRESFGGMFYMNSAYKQHLVRVDPDNDTQMRTVALMKSAHKLIQQEIFLPACGTSTRNHMADVCAYKKECCYV
jgi:hypothetical protein